VVHYLLKIREEIKKLASGHISHRTALRLEKMALFAIFLKKNSPGDTDPPSRVNLLYVLPPVWEENKLAAKRFSINRQGGEP
jgi:hypothetical protein